jgi:hypothetical protein
MSGLLGDNRNIFFPKLNEQLDLITFSDIAERYLLNLGYEPYQCKDEDEARKMAPELITLKKWPCFFFESDTTGEKDFEEFYTDSEKLNMNKFQSIGVIKNEPLYDDKKLDKFLLSLDKLKSHGSWSKNDIVELFFDLLPEFANTHKETGKYLDEKM